MADKITSKLETLPQDLYNSRLILLALQEEKQRITRSLQEWEIRAIADVAADKENSNEQKRKAALQIAKDTSSYYSDLDAKKTKMESDIKLQELNVALLSDTQQNYRAICVYGK